MMPRRTADDLPSADAFAGLLEQKGAEARHEYLDAHPDLRDRSTALRLLSEVNRLLRVDLERAESLTATIVRLAEELDDDDCRGRRASRRRSRGPHFFTFLRLGSIRSACDGLHRGRRIRRTDQNQP